jgi:hypothetical protein
VGALNEATVKCLEERTGRKPNNGAIILTDERMAHMLRKDKADKGRGRHHGGGLEPGGHAVSS